MTTTPPRIDPRLGVAVLRAPAASREDSCSQAILKFHHPSSLDYSPLQTLGEPLHDNIMFSLLAIWHLSQALFLHAYKTCILY